MTYSCPECEQELEEQEFRIMYTESDTEICWVCVNKECCNYQEVVFDSGDIDEIERDEWIEARDDEKRWEKQNGN